MAEIELDINVSGEGTIDDDINAFKTALGTMVKNAMDYVGMEMQESLKTHIITDVYDAYEQPKEYERRSRNKSLGTPLADMVANSTVYNKGAGVTLEYKPTGEHAHKPWHTADGDELIGRIERKDPPYFPKAQAIVPPRPFWQRFVDEMVDGGRLEDFFITAMKAQEPSIGIEKTGVECDAEDGDY